MEIDSPSDTSGLDMRSRVCVPGQRICLAKGHISGRGTYERQGYIHSALAGIFRILTKDKDKSVEVVTPNEQNVVPATDDVVTVKITAVNQRVCKCLIKCIGETALTRPYRAILRKEDIKQHDKDNVNVYDCFRPGDIILAKILPMTEIHSYQLTTAEDELGVVVAHSESGIPMLPVSYNEMQCPKTFNKERRKVARIVSENICVE